MKKMTSPHDKRLEGRNPEFARMSNGGGKQGEAPRGGIGANAVPGLARATQPHHEDVPQAVRVNGKIWPLGRYIRKLVRRELGRDEKAPLAVQIKLQAKLLPLLEAAKTHPTDITLKKQIIAACRTEVASLKSRIAINQKRSDFR